MALFNIYLGTRPSVLRRLLHQQTAQWMRIQAKMSRLQDLAMQSVDKINQLIASKNRVEEALDLMPQKIADAVQKALQDANVGDEAASNAVAAALEAAQAEIDDTKNHLPDPDVVADAGDTANQITQEVQTPSDTEGGSGSVVEPGEPAVDSPVEPEQVDIPASGEGTATETPQE